MITANIHKVKHTIKRSDFHQITRIAYLMFVYLAEVETGAVL